MTSQNPQRVGVWVVAASISGTVLLGAGAFWMSFTALADLAHRAGTPAELAWVWPLIVDGIIVIATMSVVALSPYGARATRYPWMLLGGAALVSVAANVTHALVAADDTVPSILAALVASVPPIVLLAVTHLTVELGHYRRQQPQRTPATPATTTTRALPAPQHDASTQVAALPLSDEKVAAPGPREDKEPTRPMNGDERAPKSDHHRSPREGKDAKDEAAMLSREGLSNRQIADKLGVHATTVGRWLRSDPATAERNQK